MTLFACADGRTLSPHPWAPFTRHLSPDPKPTPSSAISLLSAMERDPHSGLPQATLGEIVNWKSNSSYTLNAMALPNHGNVGRLALIVCDINAPFEEARVLVAQGPTLTCMAPFVNIRTAALDTPFTFAPGVFCLTLPEDVHFCTIGPPGGRRTYHVWATYPETAVANFAGDVHTVLTAAFALPPLVGIPHVGPGTLTASWILGPGNPPPELSHMVAGHLRTQGQEILGDLYISGRALRDSGAFSPVQIRWDTYGYTPTPGMLHMIHTTTEWLNDRLQAPGCPWPLHTFVAQTQSFGHSTLHLSDSSARYADRLLALSSKPANALSAHVRLAQDGAYQQALLW